MLGSFRGAMLAAQSRLKGLEKTAASAGKSVVKLGSLFSTLFAGIAAFGVGAIFKKIFEGADEAARAADQRTRALTAALMQQNFIRARGRDYAKAQGEELFKHNEALAKQGVISAELLDAGAAQLAITRLGPREIAATIGPLSDALVAFKGINATQEDMQTLAKGFGVAVQKGMTKPLSAFGIIFTDQEQKMFKAMSRRERYDELTRRVRGFAGESARALNTPLGRIQALDNRIELMQRHIGDATLESRAAMADAWGGALEQLEPIFIKIGNAAAKTATWVGHQMADATKQLSTPEAVRTWEDLGKAMRGVGNAITGTQTTGNKDETVGTMFGSWLRGALADFARDLTKTAIAITNLKAETKKWWADFYGGLLLIKPYWDRIYNKTAEWIHLIDDDHIHAGLAKIGQDMKEFIEDPLGAIINRWKEFKGLIGLGDKNAFQGGGGTFGGHGAGSSWGPVAGAAASGGPARQAAGSVNASLPQIEKAHGLPAGFLSAVAQQENVNPAYNNPLGLSGPHGPYHYSDAAAGAAAAERQARLITNPSGPYRDFVKSGYKDIDAFSRVWSPVGASNDPYGTNATEAAGIRAAMKRTGAPQASTSVNFAPVVTIHGNASEAEQRALDSRLRDLAHDFVDNFKRAQRHERRLSYEGGYS
jgi:hypothetical protein